MKFGDADVRIVSFYNDNIPEDVVRAQKAVFDKFGIEIQQTLTHLSHAEAIDTYLANNLFDVLIIFDVDCIPLVRRAVAEAVEIVTRANCIYGAAQNANYIEGCRDYASPAFICFSRETFELIGRPSFQATARGDVGAELTFRAAQQDLDVNLLKVARVSVPLWRLTDGTMFGHGTNYEEKVFHAFEIRMSHDSRRLFIEECRKVTGSLDPVGGGLTRR
jgi:hypothetical protein